MVAPFSVFNVDVSCLGNHELDHGMKKARELIDSTNVPWIITNLLEHSRGDKPILGLEPYYIKEC